MTLPQISLFPTLLPMVEHPPGAQVQSSRHQEQADRRIYNRQEIRHCLSEMEGMAEQGGLWLLKLSVEDHVIHLAITTGQGNRQNGKSAHALNGGHAFPMHVRTQEMEQSECSLTPQQIVGHVEQALKDYHLLPRLSKNELAQVLDLLAFQQPGDNEPMRNGLALRRVLDQGIDAIVGPDVRGWQGMGKWRLENYLHLRYREKRQHRDIAIQMGYTERHLQRLKQELLLDMSEILLALTHGPEPAQGLSSISNRRSGERPPI